MNLILYQSCVSKLFINEAYISLFPGHIKLDKMLTNKKIITTAVILIFLILATLQLYGNIRKENDPNDFDQNSQYDFMEDMMVKDEHGARRKRSLLQNPLLDILTATLQEASQTENQAFDFMRDSYPLPGGNTVFLIVL